MALGLEAVRREKYDKSAGDDSDYGAQSRAELFHRLRPTLKVKVQGFPRRPLGQGDAQDVRRRNDVPAGELVHAALLMSS